MMQSSRLGKEFEEKYRYSTDKYGYLRDDIVILKFGGLRSTSCSDIPEIGKIVNFSYEINAVNARTGEPLARALYNFDKKNLKIESILNLSTRGEKAVENGFPQLGQLILYRLEQLAKKEGIKRVTVVHAAYEKSRDSFWPNKFGRRTPSGFVKGKYIFGATANRKYKLTLDETEKKHKQSDDIQKFRQFVFSHDDVEGTNFVKPLTEKGIRAGFLPWECPKAYIPIVKKFRRMKK